MSKFGTTYCNIRDKGKATDKEGIYSDAKSFDQRLCFDDIISSGGEHLNFGTFKNMEIKQLWYMKLRDNVSAVINEYGTNLYKSKFDSFSTIEAKHALTTGKYAKLNELSTTSICKALDTIQEEPTEVQELVVPENASASSPYLGTQEAPVAGLSSREDAHFVEEGATQTSPRWEDVIKENEIEENGIGSQQLLSPEKEGEMAETEFNSQQVDSPGDVEVINNNIMEGSSEQVDAIDSQGQAPTRQNTEIKNQGLGNVKIADKAAALIKKKNLEGKHISSKNSFAVLSNNELIISAGKLG